MHLDQVGGCVHVVDAVVEARGETVQVLAVERGDEGGADAAHHLVGGLVSRLLEVGDPFGNGLALVVVLGSDHGSEFGGRRDEIRRHPAEQVIEPVVLGGQSKGHGIPGRWGSEVEAKATTCTGAAPNRVPLAPGSVGKVDAGPGAPHGAWPLVAADFGTRGCRGPTSTSDTNAPSALACSR